MKQYLSSCFLGLCLLAVAPMFSQTTNSDGPNRAKSKPLNKTGLLFSHSLHNEVWQTANNAQAFFDGLEDCQSFNFGVFHNLRLVKTLYYQPELSYSIYNGSGEHRLTMISLVPVQLQLAYHLGWVRPFVSGAGIGHFVLTARNPDGSSLPMKGLSQRSAWGFYYGGGMDIINTVQINFKLLHWMEGFDKLQAGPLKEYHIGLAILF